MSRIRQGRHIALVPQTISPFGDKAPTRAMMGRIISIPKHRRFFVAEFETGGARIRESFNIPVLSYELLQKEVR